MRYQKYEGYTEEEAIYGVDSLIVDWSEQASRSAKAYLDAMSFSKQGLIDQLVYDGYTAEQAAFGVQANGY